MQKWWNENVEDLFLFDPATGYLFVDLSHFDSSGVEILKTYENPVQEYETIPDYMTVYQEMMLQIAEDLKELYLKGTIVCDMYFARDWNLSKLYDTDISSEQMLKNLEEAVKKELLIEDIEYDALYTLIKLINDNNTTSLLEYKNIFEEYINIIKSIIEHNDISKRSIFFLNDIIVMLKKINNVKDDEKINIPIFNKNNKDDNEIIIEHIKKNNLTEAVLVFNSSDNKEDVLYKLTENYLENMKKNENIIEFVIKLNNNDIIKKTIEKILENINDIIIDIPDISDRILQFMSKINFSHISKEFLIEKINNIDSDDENC